MAWRRPGDKPLSEPVMVSLLTHICVTRPQWANGANISVHNEKVIFDMISSNTLRPKQNGCRFADDILICFFSNENVWIKSYFIELWCLGSNQQYFIIGLDNGLAPNRRQVIIWSNYGLVYWRIYALFRFQCFSLKQVWNFDFSVTHISWHIYSRKVNWFGSTRNKMDIGLETDYNELLNATLTW